MKNGTGKRDGGKGTGPEGAGSRNDDIEIHVSESDIKDLKILDRSDFVFAILYSVLFIWGLVLTLVSI
ncbi:MAG: hypothetical protein JSV33_08785 [bacterium]|nr:MAG: hypothetical protein JSV33_08785 [bacterium]